MGEAAEVELRVRRFIKYLAAATVVVSITLLLWLAALAFFVHQFFGAGAD